MPCVSSSSGCIKPRSAKPSSAPMTARPGPFWNVPHFVIVPQPGLELVRRPGSDSLLVLLGSEQTGVCWDSGQRGRGTEPGCGALSTRLGNLCRGYSMPPPQNGPLRPRTPYYVRHRNAEKPLGFYVSGFSAFWSPSGKKPGTDVLMRRNSSKAAARVKHPALEPPPA